MEQLKRANTLVKKSITLEQIAERIKGAEGNNEYKTFIHHSVYVSEQVKMQLIEHGYKLSQGAWDGIMVDVLIIEW